MITVTNLIKNYKTDTLDFPVLKKISLSIPEGQFVAITGRSGSGKSTLLYQLSLLDTPSSGNIVINNVDTKMLNENQRVTFRLTELGYVFQDYALIPSLTAVENVMTPLLMQGMPFDKAHIKAKHVLETVGIADKLDNLPNQLSGGQQQRVSIARAIGHDPKILFADEPTANLDNETSQQILDTFLDLHKRGQTIVMVTHEEEYAKLTDRIITLSDGIIIKDIKNIKSKSKHR